MKSYKLKLYPTEEQKDKLKLALDMCRRTYNYLLAELDKGFTQNELYNYILDLKSCYPELKQVYSKTLQEENYHLFSNLSTLSALKKKGHKVGRLRFKGKGWRKTFTYSQSGFKILKGSKKNNQLYLSKMGNIKMILHRPLEGKIKQIIIKKEVDNWIAIIQTDTCLKLKCGRKVIGIDMSPSKFGVTSENIELRMPTEINVSLKKLKKFHRNLSRKKKGSKNRLKAKKKLQINYWRLNNQKNNFYHQTSYKLVTSCKVIGVEDLNIKRLMMSNYNATNFQKSGWSNFVNKYLIYKAESAGCQIWQCDKWEPTSKKCSRCGHIKKDLKLSDRTYHCSKCGLSIDRDLNAAINIKKTCRLGTNLCGVDSSTFSTKKKQESVLKQEKRRLSSEAITSNSF